MRIEKIEPEMSDLVSGLMARSKEYVPDMSTVVGRLKHLRHVVERIDPKAFNMDAILEDTECGTVGCMFGWASRDRHFKALGLGSEPCGGVSPRWRLTTPQGNSAFDAAGAEIFGLGLKDANNLFTQHALPGEAFPLTIAHGFARIDRMIEKYSHAPTRAPQ